MKILVLGASGMLGSAMVGVLAEDPALDVFASSRSASTRDHFSPDLKAEFITSVDAENADTLASLFATVRPDVVINCIGLVKQLAQSEDPLITLPINAMLPHRLARLCEMVQARLVHISTDCVFSGRKGGYVETDQADAEDLYGRSKLLGEVEYPHTITLRTSLIGHEINSNHSLLNWFLSQQEECRGFTRAIFSGLPTVVLAQVIHKFVLTNPELHGVYHVSADPISKFDLLKLIAKTYNKSINIIADDSLVIDRSLDSTRFQNSTKFRPPSWEQLIDVMHSANEGYNV